MDPSDTEVLLSICIFQDRCIVHIVSQIRELSGHRAFPSMVTCVVLVFMLVSFSSKEELEELLASVRQNLNDMHAGGAENNHRNEEKFVHSYAPDCERRTKIAMFQQTDPIEKRGFLHTFSFLVYYLYIAFHTLLLYNNILKPHNLETSLTIMPKKPKNSRGPSRHCPGASVAPGNCDIDPRGCCKTHQMW